MPPTGFAGRRAYLDWARGIAVLLMIEAHSLDAWVRIRDRGTVWYGYGTVLGGFAAPLFLWLAGAAVAMSMARTIERGGTRSTAWRAGVARGCEIFLLAFLFRLQAFVVSPGSHPISLFRVDVLNIMGPAIAAAALLLAVSSNSAVRVAACAGAAAAFSMMTPIVRAAPFVDRLPLWIQWYLRPAGEFTTFTMLPWAGFVFAGAAVGVLISSTDRPRLHGGIAVAGFLLIVLGFATASQPSIYRVPVSFWTSSPTWFAVRTGILMVVVAALSYVPPLRVLGPLGALGRSSLFIYWIHVELVYGYASWLWRHRLPLWAWGLAYFAFTLVMYRAIAWRDGFVEAWRRRDRSAAQRHGRSAKTPLGMSS